MRRRKAGVASLAAVLILASSAFCADVAAPVFDPSPGAYKTARTVTITCATDGAEIRYTTDGVTPPGPTSTLYTGPISVTATTQFNAYAIKSGWQDSPSVSAEYRIDSQGPTVHDLVTFPTQVRETADTSINLIAVASDAATGGTAIVAAEYFIGADLGEGTGTAMQAADGAFNAPAEAIIKTADCSSWLKGSVNLHVRARDAAGNWGSVASKLVNVVDGTVPGAITDLVGTPAVSLQGYLSTIDSYSGSAAGHPVTALLDSKSSTFWQTAGTVTSETEYVILDLTGIAELQSLVVFPYGMGTLFPQELDILVSEDKTSWVKVASMKSFKVAKPIYVWQFDAIDARYIKFSAKGVLNPADGHYAIQIADIVPCSGGNALVQLDWTAPADDGYLGTAAAGYEARYSTESILETNWSSLRKATGLGSPKPPGQHESSLVNVGPIIGPVRLALKVKDEIPNWSALSNVVTVNATMTGFVLLSPDDLADATANVIPTFRFAVDPLMKPAVLIFSSSAHFPARATLRPDGRYDKCYKVSLKGGAVLWKPTASQWKSMKSIVCSDGALYWRLEGTRLASLGIYGATRSLSFDTGFVTFLTVSPSHSVGSDDGIWPTVASIPTWSWTNNTTGMQYYWVDISTTDGFPMTDRKKTLTFGGVTVNSCQPLAAEWKKIRALARTSGGVLYWRVRAKDADKVFGCVSMVKKLVVDGGEWSVGDLDLAAPAPTVTWTHTGEGLVNYTLAFSTEASFPNTTRKTLKIPAKPVTGSPYALTALDVAKLKKLATANGVTTLYYRVRGEDAEKVFFAYSDAKTVVVP